MLAIRMQRTGRTGHAQFRVIVQDSRFSPKSGRIVAYVGSYNPHTKEAVLDKDTITSYLSQGAMPSDRTARILDKEGIKLPSWYKASAPRKKEVRHPDKRRSTRPEEPKVEVTEPAAEAGSPIGESTPVEAAAEEAPANSTQEEPVADTRPAESEETAAETEVADENASADEKPAK